MHAVVPQMAEAALCGAFEALWPIYWDLSVRYELVALGAILSTSRLLDYNRLDLAETVQREYLRNGMTPFSPTVYQNTRGVHRVGFGPILERHESAFLVIDGSHRCLAAHRLRETHLIAAVISAERMPPPAAQPVTLETVQVTQGRRSRSDVFSLLQPELFRPTRAITSLAEQIVLVQQSDQKGRR